MYLAFQFDFLFILRDIRYGRRCKEGREGLTLYGAYHFARRVLPLVEVSTQHCYAGIGCGALDGGTHCRFWIRMKDSTICAIVSSYLQPASTCVDMTWRLPNAPDLTGGKSPGPNLPYLKHRAEVVGNS